MRREAAPAIAVGGVGEARRPPPLRPGDRVGVAAVSGVVDPERLDRGLAALERLGFRPEPAANLRRRRGLFPGDADERLGELHRLAADPEVRAIVFARGGHGLLPLLPRLDWELLGRHPRAWVGYSDLTPLLLEVPRRLGLVAFHGPMVAADLARGLAADEEASWRAALAGEAQEWRIDRGRGEAVEGPLLGGCLSLLVATLGTPWAPRLDGAILFLEEIGEPLYRFDRMLTHLRLSGTLAGIRGMVIGHLSDVGRDFVGASGDSEDTTARGLLARLADDLGIPFASGLAAGHESPNLTLPIGARVRLEPARGRLATVARPS
jgi:muramoyltetrapeptide carboxypeptidase